MILHAFRSKRLKTTMVWVMMLVVACSNGTEPSAGETLPAGTDLKDLLPTAEEAPEGTEHVAVQSGSNGVDFLTLDVPDANTEIAKLEFMSGYGQFFATPGFDPFSTAGPSPDAVCVGANAFAFRRADEASEALRIHRELVVPARTSGAVPVAVDELGDEGHGFTFDRALTPLPGAVYGFRVANVAFIVGSCGEAFDPGSLLDIAQSIADRAGAKMR